MERCPLCRARLRDNIVCNRCEADLSLLQAIESQAERLGQQAIHSLLTGKTAAALRQAAAARDIHATPFHHALLGFIEKFHGEELVRQEPDALMHSKE